MAKGTRTQSNAQESEAQRSDAQTTSEGTAFVSPAPSASDASRLSAEDEQKQIQDSVDRTLGNDEPVDDGREKITVKTLGSYLVQDPTTGETVESDGEPTEVTKSPFILAQIEAGRLVEA